MSEFLVLATPDLTDAQDQRILAVAPSIRLQHLPARLRRGSRLNRPETVRAWGSYLQQANVLFTDLALPDGLAPYAAKLQMIHVASAGIETLLSLDLYGSTDIPITISVGGANSTAVAEFALTFILNLAKGLPSLYSHQRKRTWIQGDPPLLLAGRTLGLVGLGYINHGLAKMAKALNMRVLACHRTGGPGERVDFVDEIVPRTELNYLLSESDFVVLGVPLTPETDSMIGEAELRAMKRSAYLVNVGRGKVVQETALVRALEEGWIAGAGLDVFEQEPLPRHHPLWNVPNVIISPHLAGVSDKFMDSVVVVLCENLGRYLSGKPLLHLLDRRRGY